MGLDIRLEYEDMATPFMKELAVNNPKWIASALKSAAYQAQKAIKEGIRSQAPGGQSYAAHALDDYHYAKLERALTGDNKGSYPIMGKLRQAVGYDRSHASEGYVTVGWLSQSAAYLGKKQQAGYDTPMTERMRRAFFAAGLHPSKSKLMTSTKARQTMAPMVPRVQEIASATMQRKILSYINGNTARSAASSGRIYRVFK